MNIRNNVLVIIWCVLCCGGSAVAADSLQTYLQNGRDSLATGSYDWALKQFQSALRLDPDNFDATKYIGRIYVNLGDHKQAKVFLERAFKMNPIDAQVCNNLGVVYSKQDSPTEAIKYFESAATLDSTNAMYLTNLAQEYFKVGRIGNALPLLRTALLYDPGSALIPYTMGNCFAASQTYDSAEYYYRLSAASGGRPAELFYRLGTVERYLGKPEAAQEAFAEALRRQPNHRQCRQALAMLMLSEGKYDGAAEQFSKLVADDSGFYAAWVGLGTAYALDGRTEKSDQILSHLFSVDSTWGFRMLDLLRQENSKSEQPKVEQ